MNNNLNILLNTIIWTWVIILMNSWMGFYVRTFSIWINPYLAIFKRSFKKSIETKTDDFNEWTDKD